jgi:hypothetical protein
LDEPEKLAAVDAHLRELADCLDLLMDQIFVWRPAPNLPQKLRCALTNNLLKHVRRMVASSCDNSKRALILPDRAPPSQPLTIREAWEPLQEGGDRQRDVRAAQVQDYEQMIDREVTAPMLEQAAAMTDPAMKSRALVQALYMSQQAKLLPHVGLGKAPRPANNGLLRPDDADAVRLAQKFLSDFLDTTHPERKKSSR